MPLTPEEYSCLESFSVLYSGGLDSCAVAILLGKMVPGGVHLLTYKHSYGTFFNEWSRKHNADLREILGDRVHHHLIDLTESSGMVYPMPSLNRSGNLLYGAKPETLQSLEAYAPCQN